MIMRDPTSSSVNAESTYARWNSRVSTTAYPEPSGTMSSASTMIMGQCQSAQMSPVIADARIVLWLNTISSAMVNTMIH